MFSMCGEVYDEGGCNCGGCEIRVKLVVVDLVKT